MPLPDEFPTSRALLESTALAAVQAVVQAAVQAVEQAVAQAVEQAVAQVDEQCDNNERTFLIQREAADLLRLSQRTLERLRVGGTGPPFVKAGRRVLYRRADLEDWVNQRIYQSTSQADAAGRC